MNLSSDLEATRQAIDEDDESKFLIIRRKKDQIAEENTEEY